MEGADKEIVANLTLIFFLKSPATYPYLLGGIIKEKCYPSGNRIWVLGLIIFRLKCDFGHLTISMNLFSQLQSKDISRGLLYHLEEKIMAI